MARTIIKGLFLILLVATAASQAQNRVVVVPLFSDGPTPGPKKLFITDDRVAGNFGGALGADSECMDAVTENAGLSGDFKALVFTTTHPTEEPTRAFHFSTGPYVSLDNQPVASSFADLWLQLHSTEGETASQLFAIQTPSGESVNQAFANDDDFDASFWFTMKERNFAGDNGLHNCAGFTSNSSTYSSFRGGAYFSASIRISEDSFIDNPGYGFSNCSSANRILCLEQ